MFQQNNQVGKTQLVQVATADHQSEVLKLHEDFVHGNLKKRWRWRRLWQACRKRGNR